MTCGPALSNFLGHSRGWEGEPFPLCVDQFLLNCFKPDNLDNNTMWADWAKSDSVFLRSVLGLFTCGDGRQPLFPKCGPVVILHSS